MVAISVPQSIPEEWSPHPGVAPGGDGLANPGREPSRRLPDRATRLRRRRLAVVVLGALLVAGGMGLAQLVGALASSGGPGDAVPARAAEPERPLPVVAGEVYVVQPGDTIWTIAAELSPDGDVRPVVDRLQAVNGGAELDVGDRLVLDVG